MKGIPKNPFVFASITIEPVASTTTINVPTTSAMNFFGLNSVHQLSLGRFVTSCFTLCSISSLISLTWSIVLPFGSSIPQSIKLGMNNVGQKDLSIHPILIIFVEFLIIIFSDIFGFLLLDVYSNFTHSLNYYWI